MAASLLIISLSYSSHSYCLHPHISSQRSTIHCFWRWIRRTSHQALLCGGCTGVQCSFKATRSRRAGKTQAVNRMILSDPIWYINCYSFPHSTETYGLHYTSLCCPHCYTSDLLTRPRFAVSYMDIVKYCLFYFYFLYFLFIGNCRSGLRLAFFQAINLRVGV